MSMSAEARVHESGHDHSLCEDCNCKLRHSLYCTVCQKIQRLQEEETYFSIFQQERNYRIDKAKINKVFDELILTLHPDFFTQQDARSQSLSLEHSSMLNQAKDVLFDPFERGKYLLGLLNPAQAPSINQPDNGFLMRMFEIQESIDSAEGEAEALKKIGDEIQTEIHGMEDELTELFNEYSQTPGNESLKEQIKNALGRIKFLQNIITRTKQTST